MKKLNIPAMKKAHNNGMPIERIVKIVNKGLAGTPLINALGEYYKGIEKK